MIGPADTRERILVTAERLFAERGIDQASIRQINRAAGQRNTSATQYHFGTRAALIAAVLDYRRAGIDQRRQAMLRRLEREGRDTELRGLVEALVIPVAELLEREDGAANYIVVVAQLLGHPRLHTLARRQSPPPEGQYKLGELISRALPEVPREVLVARLRLSIRLLFHELTDFRRVHLASGVAERHTIRVRVGWLMNAIMAVLSAPVIPPATGRDAWDEGEEA